MSVRVDTSSASTTSSAISSFSSCVPVVLNCKLLTMPSKLKSLFLGNQRATRRGLPEGKTNNNEEAGSPEYAAMVVELEELKEKNRQLEAQVARAKASEKTKDAALKDLQFKCAKLEIWAPLTSELFKEQHRVNQSGIRPVFFSYHESLRRTAITSISNLGPPKHEAGTAEQDAKVGALFKGLQQQFVIPKLELDKFIEERIRRRQVKQQLELAKRVEERYHREEVAQQNRLVELYEVLRQNIKLAQAELVELVPEKTVMEKYWLPLQISELGVARLIEYVKKPPSNLGPMILGPNLFALLHPNRTAVAHNNRDAEPSDD